VLSGAVKLSVPSLDGRELVLRVVRAGEIFGELAVLDGGVRTADATTGEACHLRCLDRRSFLTVLQRNSDRPPMSGPGLMLVQGWSGRHAARAGTNTSGAGAL
jgi:CRP-like cAMP-binding protein